MPNSTQQEAHIYLSCIPNEAFLDKGKSINHVIKAVKHRNTEKLLEQILPGSLCDWATETYQDPLGVNAPPFPFLKQQVHFGWCAQQSHFRPGQAGSAREATGHIYSFLLSSGMGDRILSHFTWRRDNEY